MSQSLFPGWRSSPAHVFLLSRFLEPRRPMDLTTLIDWEKVLGGPSSVVVAEYLASGELEYADEGQSLAAQLEGLLLSELRELAEERDLPVSGRKAELIARLIEADPSGMDAAGSKLRRVQCTAQGRSAIENYLMTGSQPAAASGAEDAQPSTPTLMERIGQPLDWFASRMRGDDVGESQGSVELDEVADLETLDIDVEAAKAHVEQARLLGSQGAYDKALSELDQATADNPNYALAYFWRGVIYERLGQYTQALAELNRAVALNPNPAEFYALRGDSYRGLAEWTLAIREYDAAIERNPKLLLAHHNRGIAHEGLGHYVNALSDYDRAIELSPEAAESYYGRGVSYEEIGDIARAREEFQSVLQVSSNATLLGQARERLQRLIPHV